MEFNSIPLAINARIADSLPVPTPLTTTFDSFTPIASAFSPIRSPTFATAKKVPFLAPRKPKAPADDQKTTLPLLSEKETFVLLKVASTKRTPSASFLLWF